MAADRGKKTKLSDTVTTVDGDDSDHIDVELVLHIEKLQETQDELEKGFKGLMDYYYRRRYGYGFGVERTHPRSPQRRAVVARLKELEGEFKKVNEEASDKVLEIEQHYNGKRRPLYVKRNQIIKTIPDFWLTVFLSHPALGDFLTDEDQKIFKYIDTLDVEYFNDVKSGYFITFEFKPNPYFEDTKLVKTITFCDEGHMKIMGTNIKWKEGMGYANGVDHGKTGNKRPAPEESFFSWFSETHQKDGAGLIRDEVAEIIKEDLWPNPLKYFSNDADEEPSLEDEDEEVDNDGEE